MAPTNKKLPAEDFFQKLTRLFRSGPSIQRRIKGQDSKSYYSNKLIQGNYGYKASAPFGFGRENSPFSVLGSYGILDRMARYSEFGEMDYCIHPDTKIAVPGGYKTIKELADEYGLDKEFVVYAYDHENKTIVPAVGRQARQTRIDHAYKVTFNSGKEIIGTSDHMLMKRDGTYCEIKDLKPGDSMMPFYRKSVSKDRIEGTVNRYQTIYTMNRKENSYGWTAEHKMLAEFLLGRKLASDEVVHHVNFQANDNRIENLKVMNLYEHQVYHAKILNGKKWDYETNSEWIENFKKNHSEWMTKNNPATRKDITFPKILRFCKSNSFNIYAAAKYFNTDCNTIKHRLKTKGYSNFVEFAKAYQPNWKSDSWDNRGIKNPRFRKDITFQSICNEFEPNMKISAMADKFGTCKESILARIRHEGYENWSEFKKSYKNHKVVSVEYYGEIPLYDLTVDKYKNFATDSVISHNCPELASGLDVYADEVVGGDDRGKCFHVFSNNEKIKEALDDLFYDVMNVEFNLRTWTRNLMKYGDFFLYIEVAPDLGVINATPIPVNELEREEGYDVEDPYSWRFKWLTRGNKYLENWQVSHFRIINQDLMLPYGTSVLEPARRIFRQLQMLEDAMLVYRIIRSPERRVFYIDVGNVDPNDVPNYMEAAKATLRSQSNMEREHGREDQRLNAMSILDDYFIPVRGNQQGTRVETISGGTHATATEDVEYIQRKLFAAIKVPKPYLNYDENLSAKATLSQMDVRFSRSVQMIQKIVISELNRLAMIHLYSKGFDGPDLINFQLKLSNPSSVALQQKLELWSVKFDTAGAAKDTGLVDINWVQKNILELGDGEINEIMKGLVKDSLRQKEIEEIVFEPYDSKQPSKTTGNFDTTNYDIPGKDVAREPPAEDDSLGRDLAGRKEKDYELSLRSYDEDGNEVVKDLNSSSSSAPIKATPFLTRHKRNRTRRVGISTGRSNIAMPNLSAMLSTKNKYNRDITGLKTESVMNEYKESSNKVIPDSSKKSELLDYTIEIEPKLNREMKSLFGKLSRYVETKRPENKLLTEEIEIDLDFSEEASGDIVGIDLINEEKNPASKDSDASSLFESIAKMETSSSFAGEEEDVVEGIEETSLKDVFEDEDESQKE